MFDAKIKPKSKLTQLTCQELISRKSGKELKPTVFVLAKPNPPGEKYLVEDEPREEKSSLSKEASASPGFYVQKKPPPPNRRI